MSVRNPVHSLVKEELRVIQHVQSWMTSKPPVSVSLSPSVFCKGAISLHQTLIKVQEIPTGHGWKWNQTRRKKEHVLGTSESMVISKLIPRRSKLSQEPKPHYKLWHVTFSYENTLSTVLFCEKGADKSPARHFSPLYGSNIALDDPWESGYEELGAAPNKMSFGFLCS